MHSALVTAPLALAVVFAMAAVVKIRHRGSALSSMRLLRLPEWLANERVATSFPWAELVLAIALVLAPAGVLFTMTAVAALLLTLVYWGLIARGLRMDPRPSCGCFGTIGSPIRPLTLARNTFLVVLAGLTTWLALSGKSPFTVLRGLNGAGWEWLLAAAATAATTALVLLSERAPAPRPQPSTTPAEDDGMLDYERAPIPSQLLIDPQGEPVPLRRLAQERAQLLLWVTCGCSRSHTVVEQFSAWRDAMPQIDVRLVSTLPPETTEQTFPTSTAEFFHDPEHTTFTAVGFRNDPGALLLGADGLLAGGPVSGLDEVLEFVDDVANALSEAPAPEAAVAPEATADEPSSQL